MAQDKKRKNTAYQKKAGSEFQKGAGNAFTGGGSAAYQPRDANTGKTGQSAGRKKQTEKSMQAQQETFGQKRAVDKPPYFINAVRYYDKILSINRKIF